MKDWVKDELGGISCGDFRLNQRCVKIAKSMSSNPASSIYSAQKESSDVKAAYRFFSNSKISHQTLQQPHYHNVLEKAQFSKETAVPPKNWTEKQES